jgi:hypothetical protein
MRKSTIRENVEKLLANAPNLREDDKALMRAYYEIYHDIKIPESLISQGIPDPGTIRRNRQHLQEQGKYLPLTENTRYGRYRHSGPAMIATFGN